MVPMFEASVMTADDVTASVYRVRSSISVSLVDDPITFAKDNVIRQYLELKIDALRFNVPKTSIVIHTRHSDNKNIKTTTMIH